ncbi:MAG: efflux RND transporter periplasmic adaptor subunit [Aquimonas sp.]|jgi:HlyD family secretion protein|nr:efflux RND transporter periplasmic adaptor subunit [Xanthomonadales bacterium]MCC6504863.1 efflux RND transporter periplasmic adaptor subunit [Aquimonas sp.]
MRHRKLWVGLALAVGFAVMLGIASQRRGAAVEVNVAAVTRAALADTTLASGSLIYAQQIQLRSEVTGRVADVLVEEGERVSQGQVLMRLDPDAFQADLEAASAGVRAAEIEIESRQARLDELQRQLARQKVLLGRGLVGRETFEQLENDTRIADIAVRAGAQTLRQQRAQRDVAADRLERTVFAAPIDGLLISVDVKPGETVIAGTLNIVGSDLMVLADPSVLLAELRVDEADIAQVRLGQSVQVFAASAPATPLTGEVIHIASSARQLGTAQSLAFRVKVRLQPSELALHPGMSCRAEILTATGEPSLNVPVAAIRRDGDAQYVWSVSADQIVERVSVVPGMANDLDQAVEGALQEGDQVVTGPGRVLATLQAGTRITIKPADADAESATDSAEDAAK